MTTDRTENTALFRAHATARLTGDTAEAVRLAASIGDEQRMSHLLFTLTLFSQFVLEELGYEPDPADLTALTKRLHDKHYRPGGSFEALRAEAMIRAVTVESILLTEIPHFEQGAYMWVAIDELADPRLTESELGELFELAQEAGAELFDEVLDSPVLAPMRRQAAQARPPASDTTATTADTTERAEGAEAAGAAEATEAAEGVEAVEAVEGPPATTAPAQTAPHQTAPIQEGTDA